jgi:acetyltransferase
VRECLTAAKEIGYPVVLKVDAESVLHKTDQGGVVLDISDLETLRKHGHAMASRFADARPRFLLQEHLSGGQEVIIGANAVEGLGHVVMFGLGGIFVEVLKDVSFCVTPVTAAEARGMIESLRAFELLSGVRGRAGADLAVLSNTIERVSRMLMDNPEIRELDINPVFAFADHVRAADIRVII